MGCNARPSKCVGCIGKTGVTNFVGMTRTVVTRKVIWERSVDVGVSHLIMFMFYVMTYTTHL